MTSVHLVGSVALDTVELGFHLCYGDLDAKPFVQPVYATNSSRHTRVPPRP